MATADAPSASSVETSGTASGGPAETPASDKGSDSAESGGTSDADSKSANDTDADTDEGGDADAEEGGDAETEVAQHDSDGSHGSTHNEVKNVVSVEDAVNAVTTDDESSATEGSQAAADVAERVDSSADEEITAAAAAPAAAPEPPKDYREAVADAIALWMNDSQSWIDSLQISDPFKDALTGTLWTVRRTFLNQAPTVAPIQIRGQIDGPIQGNIGAVDPDGDTLFYVLTRGPSSGTVAFNADGSYTYVPGTTFDGVDSFSVTAVDPGLHMNVLDLFRPFATNAGLLVNQRAVTFDFDYTTGAQYWTPEAREALQRSANVLMMYLLVTQPVTLRYQVTGRYEPDTGNLGYASSNFVSGAPGFQNTLVQDGLLNGKEDDESSTDYDGLVSFNMANNWAYGDTIAEDQDDFYDTAIHELLHSYGFTSNVDAAGENTGHVWSILDSFLVDADGNRVIDEDFEWDTAYDANLTGGDGGLYLDGEHAYDAYGAYVPVYTPDPWKGGSSVAHLDDDTFTGDDRQMMNAHGPAGTTIRRLSAIELGILADIGYHVNPLSSADLQPVLRLANQ